MFVRIYVHSAVCSYNFCNLCRKLTFNFKNAFSNLFSLKADAIYVAVLLKVLRDIESITIKKKKKKLKS